MGVFSAHPSAFVPLAELVFVVDGLVSSETGLDTPDGVDLELVKAEFEVDKGAVDF